MVPNKNNLLPAASLSYLSIILAGVAKCMGVTVSSSDQRQLAPREHLHCVFVSRDSSVIHLTWEFDGVAPEASIADLALLVAIDAATIAALALDQLIQKLNLSITERLWCSCWGSDGESNKSEKDSSELHFEKMEYVIDFEGIDVLRL